MISGTMTSGISTHDHAGERRAGGDQQHQRADQLDRRAQRDRQVHAGDGLHQRRVGRQPRQHFAGARDFEERRIHAHDAAVDVRAQVGDDALAQPGDEIEAQRGEHAEHRGRAEERDEVEIDGRAILHRHALSMSSRNAIGSTSIARRRDQQRDQREHQVPR